MANRLRHSGCSIELSGYCYKSIAPRSEAPECLHLPPGGRIFSDRAADFLGQDISRQGGRGRLHNI